MSANMGMKALRVGMASRLSWIWAQVDTDPEHPLPATSVQTRLHDPKTQTL